MSDLTYALAAIRDTREGYETAEAYSEGKVPEVFQSARMKRLLDGVTGKFGVNWARTTITAVLDLLELNAVTIDDPEMQAVIDEAWKRNALDIEMPACFDDCLTSGDTYLIVWDGADDDAPEAEVTIDRHSATNVRIFYDERNPRKKKYAVNVWQRADAFVRADLYYPDRIERYVSKAKPGEGVDFSRLDYEPYAPLDEDGEVSDWPLLNPFGQIPVFHARTETPYGRPEHRDAYGPQNALNKLVNAQMSTVDFASWPQRYALEDDAVKAAAAETPSDDYFDDDDEEGTRTGDGSDRHFVASPGSIAWLKGAKTVGEFTTAPPSTFLEPIRAYIEFMAQTTSTPLHAYQLGGQPPTGESRRRAETPLIRKGGRRQLYLTSFIREVFAFVLLVAGYELEDDELIAVEWEPMQLADDAEGFALIEAKIAAGIPRRVALLEAGYTSRQLDAWGVPDIGAEPAAPDAPVEKAGVVALGDDVTETGGAPTSA